jgi:hypothetical protein
MSEKLRGAQKDRGCVWPIGRITFLRGIVTPLTAVVALFGCAPERAPAVQPQAAAPAAAVSPAGPAYAKVAAVRPIGAFGSSGDSPDAAILPAMGISTAAAARSGAMSEIIVHTDRGDTLSVVQPSDVALVPGERVLVLPAASGRRLVPAPPPS